MWHSSCISIQLELSAGRMVSGTDIEKILNRAVITEWKYTEWLSTINENGDHTLKSIKKKKKREFIKY